MTEKQITYTTLEEIRLHKEKLREDIRSHNEQISMLWTEITAPQKANSKGEFAANLLMNTITAIDGFILVRKLIKNYGFLFRRKKNK